LNETPSFWVGDLTARENGVSFSLSGCLFDFADVLADAPDAILPVGGKVASVIVGSRRDFKIAIMLLNSN